MNITSSFNLIFPVTSLILLGIVFYLANYISEFKKYAGDIAVRKYCYKKRKPLGRLVNKSGIEFEFVVETNDEKPGLVQHEVHTLRNPDLVKFSQRGHLSNGVPVINYVLPYDFPASYQSAAALTQLLDHVRENYPELNWIGDIEIIENVFKSSKYLFNDCKELVSHHVEMGDEIPDQFFGIDGEEAEEEFEEDEFDE